MTSEAITQADREAAARVDFTLTDEMHLALIQAFARHRTTSLAAQDGCPSCHGLNISCPEGCGRDPVTGELDGSTLRTTTQDGLVERIAEALLSAFLAGRGSITARERRAYKPEPDMSHFRAIALASIGEQP